MSTRLRTLHGQLRHLHGYRRGFYDPRDFRYGQHFDVRPKALPPSASTRTFYQPPVRDQLQFGSCTSNAGCSAAGFLFRKQTGKPDPLFSRFMLYAQTRLLEGTPLSEDAGAYVRDVFKAMSKTGVCLERTWTYKAPHLTKPPSKDALDEGKHHRALVYLKCGTLAEIRASIAAGYPVIGGFTCFSSIDSAAVNRTGDIPMPGPGDAMIGGHCVMFDSYGNGALGFQNSWGTSWGKGGFGRLPYGYVQQGLADDFWTIRRELTR